MTNCLLPSYRYIRMRAAKNGLMVSGAIPAYRGNQLNTKVLKSKDNELAMFNKSFHDKSPGMIKSEYFHFTGTQLTEIKG